MSHLKDDLDYEAFELFAQEKNSFKLVYEDKGGITDRVLDLKTNPIHLDLSSTAVGDKVAEALSSSRNVHKVETLDLSRTSVTSKGFEDIYLVLQIPANANLLQMQICCKSHICANLRKCFK